MQNSLRKQLNAYKMVNPGEQVYCAVSGGADSMALLWGMYLLRDILGITLQAVHFNHGLRGEESDRDEQFVREFCHGYDIPLTVGRGNIVPGEKGLEAAAREARYAFFATLPGKVATAHTADDNAETVLMHLVRGTGLKGLGGIAPVRGNLIRPMLGITRQQVLAFLQEYHIAYVEDSSNGEDVFLRNRLRHHVMPLLKQENPSLAENLSDMAMALRRDEAQLEALAKYEQLPNVEELKALPQSVRSRMLERFLKEHGVREPERRHIALAEALVFSEKPSASAVFPGGVTLSRSYDRLEAVTQLPELPEISLPEEGEILLRAQGLRVICTRAATLENTQNIFTVEMPQRPVLRSRKSGDRMRLPGGSKCLKKLMIDRKIPAQHRSQLPVIADETGVLGVFGIGVNEDRKAKSLPAWQLRLKKIDKGCKEKQGDV